MSLALYDFNWDCGRMGSIEGLVIADKKEILKYINKTVYFGEVLGKHSGIEGTLDLSDLTIISEDQDKIEWLLKVMKEYTINGYNPLEYIEMDEEE